MNKKELKKFIFYGMAISMAVAVCFIIIYAFIYVSIGYLTSNVNFNTPSNHTTLNNVIVDDEYADSVWVFKTQESN